MLGRLISCLAVKELHARQWQQLMVIDGRGSALGLTARQPTVSKRATLPVALVDEKRAAYGIARVQCKSPHDNLRVVHRADDQDNHDGATGEPRDGPDLRVTKRQAECTKLEPAVVAGDW